MIEPSTITSIVSLCIAGFALYRNIKGDTKTDAGQLTTVIVKLDRVSDDIREIKSDMKDFKKDVDDVKERCTLNKASIENAHKRIDYLQALVSHNANKKEENKED